MDRAAALAILAGGDFEPFLGEREDLELEFKRQPGQLRGRLSWKPAHGVHGHPHYRVYRDGAVVGQTTKLSMRIRISLDRNLKLVVRPVTEATSMPPSALPI